MDIHDRPLIEQMAVAYATEIERLRAALEEIAALDGSYGAMKFGQIARKALAKEEGK